MTSWSKRGCPLASCALVLVVACRFAFDPVADGGAGLSPDALGGGDPPDADLSPDAPGTPCVLGPWISPDGTPPFENVNTTDAEWAAELSSDGLVLLFQRNSNPLFVAQRSSLSAIFDTPVLLAIGNAPETNREPAMNDSELYFISHADGAPCIYAASRLPPPGLWGTPRRLDALCPDGLPLEGGLYISRDSRRLYYDAGAFDRLQLVMASRSDILQDFATAGAPVAFASSAPRGYCSLTGDELTIYCESDRGGIVRVWQAERPDLASPFGAEHAVSELDTGTASSDPSLSADGLRLLYAVDMPDRKAELRLVERGCQ